MLFNGSLPIELNRDLQQWMHLWLNITRSWYVLLLYYGCLDVHCLHKFSKYFPYKLSIEKQRSILDAWGFDLQNDVIMCKQRAFSAMASSCSLNWSRNSGDNPRIKNVKHLWFILGLLLFLDKWKKKTQRMWHFFHSFSMWVNPTPRTLNFFFYTPPDFVCVFR